MTTTLPAENAEITEAETATRDRTRAEKRADRKADRRRGRTWIVLGSAAGLWLYLALVPLHLLHNPAVLPVWALLGAALVPGTILWIMAHRLSSRDTLSPAKLLEAALVGGLFSIAIGATLDQLVAMIPQPVALGHGVISLALAGFVEELAKGVLIVAVGWSVVKTARNGLFIGAAVGTGFAVAESMFYILTAFTSNSPVVAAAAVTVERGVTAPFMHILWSALLGAALFASAEAGRFRLTPRVLAAYVGVAVLHGVYDGGGSLIGILVDNPRVGEIADIPLMLAVIATGVLVWRRVAQRSPAAAPAAEHAA